MSTKIQAAATAAPAMPQPAKGKKAYVPGQYDAPTTTAAPTAKPSKLDKAKAAAAKAKAELAKAEASAAADYQKAELAKATAAKAKAAKPAKDAAEAAAGAANTAKLATVKTAAAAAKAAAPKAELPKGDGALIGVAQGAMDGQPHTRRAVEVARKAARAEAKADTVEVLMHGRNKFTRVAHDDPRVHNGVLYANETTAKMQAQVLAEKKTAVPKAAPAPKAAKAAKVPGEAAAAPKAITILDKAYTFGAEGTARRASWDACKSSKTTADYAAKGGKAKYLSRWVAAGAIALA